MTARVVFLITVLAIVLLALLLALHVGRKAELEVESHGSEVGLVVPGPALEPTTTTAKPVPTTVPRRVVRSAPIQAASAAPAVVGSGACGGDLPPCSVMMSESGGSPTAVNRTGCGGRGCYGKWQFDPVTFIPGCTVRLWDAGKCGTYQGYQFANEAPEAVQDARAREIWAGGRGRSHWGV